ncbi:MAG: hypothetical protein ACHQDC_08955, partial [Acidimicrobiales bacterium]
EHAIEVQRVIDLHAPIDEVWDLVCRADLWLADEGALGLGDGPGAIGRLVERGKARTTRLDHVDVGRRIAFHWWDERGDEGDASRVEITLVPSDGPTQLVVRETLPVRAARPARTGTTSASSTARTSTLLGSSANWEIRLMCLASQVAFRTLSVLV